MDDPQVRACGFGLANKFLQAFPRRVLSFERLAEGRFGCDEAVTRFYRFLSHLFEDFGDGGDLRVAQSDFVPVFQKMRRTGLSVEFCGKGEAPAATLAKFVDVRV